MYFDTDILNDYSQSDKDMTNGTGYTLRSVLTSEKDNKTSKSSEAFSARTGICYTDKNGKAYTYHDLFSYCMTPEATAELFERLNGKTPERVLQDGWGFEQCPRCGTWSLQKDRGLFGKHESICRFCTPKRTNGRIRLIKDPYEDDRKFYRKSFADFHPGITTLVGCNGAGKSTLLNNMENILKQRGTPCMHFDNLSENGGEKSFGKLLTQALYGNKMEGVPSEFNNVGYAASLLSASEGERIAASLIRFANIVWQQIRKYSGYGEIWLLFDALDSGLSVDVIEHIKEYVFRSIINKAPADMQVYIIVSSNSYEMCEGTDTFSLEKMQYVGIRSYNAYKKTVMSSAVYKEKRDDVFRVKAEIWNRKYVFEYSEEIAEGLGRRSLVGENELASMQLGSLKLCLMVRITRYRESAFRYCLYEQQGDAWIPAKAKGLFYDLSSRADKDRIEEDMHEQLCRITYSREKNKTDGKSNA